MVSMGERIKRQTDENVYQPKIHSERIKELFEIRVQTGFPLTVLVDTAIREFVGKYRARLSNEDIKRFEPGDVDDFEDLSTYLDPYQNDPFGENY